MAIDAPVLSGRTPVAKPAPAAGPESSPRTPRRLTANHAAFYATVEPVPPSEAVWAIQDARTAASTKGTYRAALPLYEAACLKGGLVPWPPSRDTLDLFAGYLKDRMAFASPSTYWWAVVDEARQRNCSFPFDRDCAKVVIVALERGLGPQE